MNEPAPVRPAAVTVTSPDGHPVAAWDFGGDGPAILLAHANGFHTHLWLPLVEQLGSGFRCVGFDLRGQGDTPPPADGDFDWSRFGMDALAVADALELHRPFGLGHSCGGAALCLAEAARPGTFRSLYLYEPILFPPLRPGEPGSSGQEMATVARRRREVFTDGHEALASYRGRGALATLPERALQLYVEHGFAPLPGGGIRLKARAEHEARVFEGSRANGAFDRLSAVRCPVTVAIGGRTAAPPPAAFHRAAAALPAGRAEVMAGLTHFGPFEDPVAVAQSVQQAFAAGP